MKVVGLALISLLVLDIALDIQAMLPGEETRAHWDNLADEALAARLQHPDMTLRANRIIFFLGDGMSVTTVTAARILKGQLAGKSGEEASLEFDKFPHTSLSKTYSLNKQVADSAATATAYLCGAKANQGTIGVDGRVPFDDCQANMNPDTHLVSILAKAQAAGMSTGVVTTARITHASPAGNYAHVANRNWEGKSPSPDCPDIATQLVTSSPGDRINVLFGGGSQMFVPQSTPGSGRKDNKDLLQKWKDSKKTSKAYYVTTKDQMNAITEADYVLGLFNETSITYILDKQPDSTEPTLTEMAAKAIEILNKNPKGFFLFVEGGRIDHGHHEGKAKKALFEAQEFDKAIGKAVEMTDPSDTIIIVTADHAHTMTLNGYPPRGNNIFGFGGVDENYVPYTTLQYANGPGAHQKPLTNLTDTTGNDYQQPALVPTVDESHGGEDVAVFARGTWSQLFRGVHEQSYIPHALEYASCLSKTRSTHCV